MARDIEEFLRRAAERRKQQLQGQKQAPAQRPAQRLPEVISEVEIVEPAPSQPMREQGIAESVRSHINTSDIAEHAEHLGERIQNVDERVADRLGQKFDREVTRLGDSEMVTDQAHPQAGLAQASPAAEDLIQMLSSPQTLRQAILVSEILRRPHFDD
ncbi:MAG: hypothetical protein MK108_02275 [Mariniblastus sp.]|nr:hypothetical protein [Mariniblastus sp.]